MRGVSEFKKNRDINETKGWFFEKINKTDVPQARLILWEKREKYTERDRERKQLSIFIDIRYQ